MKTKTSLLGAIFGLLLFVAPLQAQSQHVTSEQVTAIAQGLLSQYRDMSDPILQAYVMGSGVTFYANGTYKLDTDSNISGFVQEQTYEQIMSVTGDPILAAQGAVGLLTQAELDRARGQNSFGGGSWGTLHTFYGFYGLSYQDQGGGGGGYLN